MRAGRYALRLDLAAEQAVTGACTASGAVEIIGILPVRPGMSAGAAGGVDGDVYKSQVLVVTTGGSLVM